MQSEHVII